MGLSFVIVGPHNIVQVGLRELFTNNSAIDNVYEATNVEDMEKYLASNAIDLVVIYQSLIKEIKLPIIFRLLIIADVLDKQMLPIAHNIGAFGYILVDSVEGLLQSIVYLVEKGGERSFLLDPFVTPNVLSSIDEELFLSTDVNLLTPRQREVFCLLHQGLDDPAIAKQLDIEETTVRSHVADILQRLHVTRPQIKQLPLPEGRYIRKRRSKKE